MSRTLLWAALSAMIGITAEQPAPIPDTGDQQIVIYDGPPRCHGSQGVFPSPPWGAVHRMRGIFINSDHGAQFWETSLPPREALPLDRPANLSPTGWSAPAFIRNKMDYIRSYSDARAPTFAGAVYAIEFVGQKEEFTPSYVQQERLCRPDYGSRIILRPPSYRFTRITHVTRCATIEGCGLAGGRMILSEEKGEPASEYSGVLLNLDGLPYFLTDPTSRASLLDRPDRVPVVEGQWGMFDSVNVVMPAHAYRLFAIRFIGHRSPDYWSPFPQPLPGKIVIDRLIALKPCPFDIKSCVVE